jgi:hypothetical protein
MLGNSEKKEKLPKNNTKFPQYYWTRQCRKVWENSGKFRKWARKLQIILEKIGKIHK